MNTHLDKNNLVKVGLSSYTALLSARRHSLNLLGPNEDIEEHIEDCLAPVRYFTQIAEELLERKPACQNTTLRCVDLGTGAGLPGIVLALYFYAAEIPAHWHLLEKSPRKCLFLAEAIETISEATNTTLPLSIVNDNLHNWQLNREQGNETFCLATARAFRPLTRELLFAIKKALAPAVLLLYKGRKEKLNYELTALKADMKILNIFSLDNLQKKERHLLHALVKH